MSAGSKNTWADFWQAGGAGPESGCLPKALAQIDAAQRRVWAELVRLTPRKGRVLDLATGDGAVLGKIRGVRPDLILIGVDSSPKLPPAPKGVDLRAGISIEDLPFAAESFDLITSQFGFEYADTHRAAAEASRVLKRGGEISFILHHADGPIVAHNKARRAALSWAVDDSGALKRGRAIVDARARLAIPTPPFFHQLVAQARTLFPQQTVAAEFVTAVLQTLELGSGRPPAESREVFDTLEARGRNEIARIDALGAAACDPHKIEMLASQLGTAGIETRPPEPVREEQSSRHFAWHLAGRKA